MGAYIFFGVLVSLITIVLIWTTGNRQDDLAKWLLTLALAASGWALYPLYIIGGVSWFVRKQTMKANAESDRKRAVEQAKRELEAEAAEKARQMTAKSEKEWVDFQKRSHPQKFDAE